MRHRARDDEVDGQVAKHATAQTAAAPGVRVAGAASWPSRPFTSSQPRRRPRQGPEVEAALVCKTADEAVRRAERLAPLRLGVVAFSATGDMEMGDFDETPTILFKSGRLPPPFEDA